jgi:murein peptide amidase A
MKQWAAFAKQEHFRWKGFVTIGDYPVYFLESCVRGAQQEAIYVSAGLHGDEPAPPWGLLEWAQEHARLLHERPFLIFPCLNPFGLINNTRRDERGVDLNRSFNHLDDPLIAAWLQVMTGRKVALGLCLHEDYDAQGCYLYELTQGPSQGSRILQDVSQVIPSDTRRSIEGRKAHGGVILRRKPPELPGHPEAVVLHLMGAPLTLTFETPSEFSLLDRIAAQKQFISAALRHGLASQSGRRESCGPAGRLLFDELCAPSQQDDDSQQRNVAKL